MYDQSAKGVGYCPHLPLCPEQMDYRSLNQFGSKRDSDFYLSALRYSQFLWVKQLPARAILSLCRAMYAPLSEDDSIYKHYPLPYQAFHWLLLNGQNRGFLGNPRISFQHQTERIRGKGHQRIRARAHAMWWLSCRALPLLPPDTNCPEPSASLDDVLVRLDRYGIPGESRWFIAVARAYRPSSPDSSITGSPSGG